MRTMIFLKKVLVACLFVPLTVLASGAELVLDRAPDRTHDVTALQNGAKLFVNYCLNCHGASAMRYNRLRELGLNDQQIKDNLMFAADKIGEPMTVAMQRNDARQWFGAWPPDLSVIARSRASEFGSGADWLYTYLRTFYKDPARPTGWNNLVFENVGMPHVLWELQGEQVLENHKLKLVKQGKMSPDEFNSNVADLVSFLVYMSEPVAEKRKQLGIGVLMFLAILLVISDLLTREYWKDIH